jgi:ABC-type multidrug transport system fused ATPase/permease subunit
MGWLFFCTISNSFLLNRILIFLDSPFEPTWIGLVIALALFLAEALRSASVNHRWIIAVLSAVRTRAAIRFMIYNKVTRLRDSSIDAGRLANLITNDAQRIHEAILFGEVLLCTPATLLVALLIIWGQLGPAVLAGFCVMLLAVPLQGWIGNWLGRIRKCTIAITDERAAVMAEVLAGVRLVKFFGWERAFAQRIASIRAREVAQLARAMHAGVANMAATYGLPVLVTLAAFAAHALGSGSPLTPSQAFVTIAIFNVARFPLSILHVSARNVSEAFVACARIQAFLALPEIGTDDLPAALEPTAAPVVLRLTGASFTWPSNAQRPAALPVTDPVSGPGPRGGPPASAMDIEQGDDAGGRLGRGEWPGLQGISLDLAEGECVAVVGPVGAGKSSLLQALLGQMQRLAGGAGVRGRVAYVAQAPWVFNGSFRDNVLAGLAWDAERYAAAVAACALGPDIEALPGGDATELGERGVNLSGGQRARLALARAIFSNADLYLLDDPLSAVDVHVAQHLWRHAIRGALTGHGKAVLLVTHQVRAAGFL